MDDPTVFLTEAARGSLVDGDAHLIDSDLSSMSPPFGIDGITLRSLWFIDTTTGELV